MGGTGGRVVDPVAGHPDDPAHGRAKRRQCAAWRRGNCGEDDLGPGVEQAVDGKCLIRAELPGLDPDKDVERTAENGVLTIHAECREEIRQARRSEFGYGSLTRSVTLPEAADPDNSTARYENGILEVSAPVREQAKPTSHRISVQPQLNARATWTPGAGTPRGTSCFVMVPPSGRPHRTARGAAVQWPADPRRMLP